MSDPFAYVDSILNTKKNLMQTPDDEKGYPAFMINRAMSYYHDTLMIANFMNGMAHLDGKLQYDFHLNTVRPWKRGFRKWHKTTVEDDTKIVAEYYGLSMRKANEVVKLHTAEQLDHMRSRLNTGGLKRKA